MGLGGGGGEADISASLAAVDSRDALITGIAAEEALCNDDATCKFVRLRRHSRRAAPSCRLRSSLCDGMKATLALGAGRRRKRVRRKREREEKKRSAAPEHGAIPDTVQKFVGKVAPLHAERARAMPCMHFAAAPSSFRHLHPRRSSILDS